MHFKIVDTPVFATTEGENIMKTCLAGVSKFLASFNAVPKSFISTNSNSQAIDDDDLTNYQNRIDTDVEYSHLIDSSGLIDTDADTDTN